jgi:hypothetical protein
LYIRVGHRPGKFFSPLHKDQGARFQSFIYGLPARIIVLSKPIQVYVIEAISVGVDVGKGGALHLRAYPAVYQGGFTCTHGTLQKPSGKVLSPGF